MSDAEITTAILRQIRDQLERTNERLDRTIERGDANFDRLETRMLVSETILRDVYGQLLDLNRHVKSANDAAIDDLRVRVATLEKKVG